MGANLNVYLLYGATIKLDCSGEEERFPNGENVGGHRYTSIINSAYRITPTYLELIDHTYLPQVKQKDFERGEVFFGYLVSNFSVENRERTTRDYGHFAFVPTKKILSILDKRDQIVRDINSLGYNLTVDDLIFALLMEGE